MIGLSQNTLIININTSITLNAMATLHRTGGSNCAKLPSGGSDTPKNQEASNACQTGGPKRVELRCPLDGAH